ncbi:hypothetical protein ACFQ36_05930 [Arthrobacter sp. GCM10027362]|uniref:hypothetical protein n=1 Tax=Arthrobacter sp. GCM10027362 TaxID=3273379 RepID=UPI00363F5D3A
MADEDGKTCIFEDRLGELIGALSGYGDSGQDLWPGMDRTGAALNLFSVHAMKAAATARPGATRLVRGPAGAYAR